MNIRFAMVLLVTLQLGACSSALLPLPGRDTDTAGATVAAPGPAAVARDNPYLKGRRPVGVDAMRRFELANAAMEQGQWEQAAAELLWLVENNPELSGPCLNLALLYRARGDEELAEQYFQRALRVNENNLVAYNQYAIFLREQGRFVEAEAAYLRALNTWELHADTHRNLGVLYDMYMGEKSRALQHFYRYQTLVEGEDRTVSGWIADLERQQMQLVQGGMQ